MAYPEQLEVVNLEDYREWALTMRTIGWMLLVVDVMVIGLFASQGLRDGSLLFPVWAMAQGLVGMALVAAGVRKHEIATALEVRMAPTRVAEEARPDLPRAA